MQYKSEKRIIEEVFPLAGLCLLASGGSKNGEFLRNAVEEEISKIIIGKDRKKIERRIARLNWTVGIGDMIKNSVHGHKFILIWHKLAELLLGQGFLNEQIVNSFEPFLEIEAMQEKENSEWLMLKKSSEKQAKKILEKLKQQGLYL